jgi:hypothetical protein
MSTGEPIEKGQTIRYPPCSLLCVNSENSEKFDVNGFRVDTTTPGDIAINKQQPLLFGYLTRIALTEMNIQWGFPNVYNDAPTGSSSNNTMTIRVYDASGVVQGTQRVIVGAGFYSAGLLGSVLQNALNANTVLTAGGTRTFTVGVGGLQTVNGNNASFSGQTKLASSSSFTIDLSGAGFFQIVPFSQRIVGLSTLQDDLTNMMGLTPPALSGLPYYKTFTGGYASMMRTPYIDVVSNALTTNQNVRDNDTTRAGRDSLLARVYLANEESVAREITITYGSDAPYASVAFSDNAFGVKETAFRREFKFPKQIQWNNTENIDFVDLRVLDYRGNVIQYQPTIIVNGSVVQQANTADIQFTIMATEV